MQLSSHTIKVRLIAHPASFQKSKIQVYSRVGRNLILSRFEQVRDISKSEVRQSFFTSRVWYQKDHLACDHHNQRFTQP